MLLIIIVFFSLKFGNINSVRLIMTYSNMASLWLFIVRDLLLIENFFYPGKTKWKPSFGSNQYAYQTPISTSIHLAVVYSGQKNKILLICRWQIFLPMYNQTYRKICDTLFKGSEETDSVDWSSGLLIVSS